MIESRSTAMLSVSTPGVSTGLTDATQSVWHVFTELGTQVMTLGALEAALLRGDVSLSTLVWIPGLVEWESISEVANLQARSVGTSTPRTGVLPSAKRSHGAPKRPPLRRAGVPRWRRAATLTVALVLILLGGRRLAEAVAQQQRPTVSGPALPVEAAPADRRMSF